jgi:NADH:ubiquinone oxidoreductase subunit 5 (subunit L)/multisubunit Na+/H+ antiporter MnhA subunit
VRVGQLILLGEGVAAISLSPFAPDPLLQAACLIVGVVSAYSAFYLKRRLGFFAAGYALSLGAVGLFTLSKHPIARFAGWEGVSVIAWALVAYGRGGTPRSLKRP